jgi:rhodanese-related sulfurtransferase
VEAMDKVLAALLDGEMSDLVEKHMKDKGVILKLGQKLAGFEGDTGKLLRTVTDKETIESELAIVAIGVRPDTKLAREAGLETGPRGEIVVDDYLQTSDPDIFAGGDCVANLNIVTGQRVLSANGSTANKHGHIIAANLMGGREKFPGIVNTACVKVFDFNIGRTGVTEKQAQDMKYNYVAAMVAAPDKPDYYPGYREMIIKLVVDKGTGRILGGQGVGPGDVIKRLDVLTTAITMGMTVDMLANLDLCYAPPYNAALDGLHHLANLVRNKMTGMVQGVKPAEIKEKLDKKQDFVLLDVRSHLEHDKLSLETPQVALIPLPSLIKNIEQLPKDKEIIVACRRGGRAFQASCTLKGEGFKDVKIAEGGFTAWCGDVVGTPHI